jgi:hypothetical protein
MNATSRSSFAGAGLSLAGIGCALIVASLAVARASACDSGSAYGHWVTLLVLAAGSGALAIVLGIVDAAVQLKTGRIGADRGGSVILVGVAVVVATPTVGYLGGFVVATAKCGFL